MKDSHVESMQMVEYGYMRFQKQAKSFTKKAGSSSCYSLTKNPALFCQFTENSHESKLKYKDPISLPPRI